MNIGSKSGFPEDKFKEYIERAEKLNETYGGSGLKGSASCYPRQKYNSSEILEIAKMLQKEELAEKGIIND